MHTLEAAQEPILSAVAHEAAGPAVAHDETSNPALIFVDRVVGTSVEACAAFLVALLPVNATGSNSNWRLQYVGVRTEQMSSAFPVLVTCRFISDKTCRHFSPSE
jgi:hypothetical protein